MKFSEKMCFMIILKVIKNQGFALSVEDTYFEKRQGKVKLTPPSFLPAVLGLSSDAMLNTKKINPELISYPDMYIFFEKEVEFLVFLIDIVKPTISIINLMTKNMNQNMLYI